VHFEKPNEAAVEAAVRRAVGSWGSAPTRLLQVLRETQEEPGFLPPQALERIAGGLCVRTSAEVDGKRVGFATPVGPRRFDERPISAQASEYAPRPRSLEAK
jgi:hypothetical protein